MEHRILILGLCISTLQVQISVSDDPKCADVKTSLDQVDVCFKKMQNTSNFNEAVSAVNNLNGEIFRYTFTVAASGCEDKDKKSQVSALLSDINEYKNEISKVVKNYTKEIQGVKSKYGIACPSLDATTPKDLADAVSDLLNSIKASSTAQDTSIEKLVEKTINNTKTLSIDIFSCVLDYHFNNTKSDITKFNDSLTKPLDEVESLKLKLNETLTEKVEKFEYAIMKLKGFDGKHDFSKCNLNTNVTERVNVAGVNAYKSFGGIAKNLTVYLNDGFMKKCQEFETNIGKCNDTKCIDTLLDDVQVLRNTVDYDIKNYKADNITSIANKKMQEALGQFDKEADTALNCYMKLIASGSLGNANLYKQSLTLLGLLIVSKFVLC